MKFKSILLKTALTLGFILIGITNVNAAKLYFTPASSSLSQGQSGQVTIYIDTEGKDAYGIEGVINVTGSAVSFNNLAPAGNINSTEFTEGTMTDTKISFRVLTFDGIIEGVEAIAKMNYTALSSGTTTLSFASGGNFDTSSVAEDVTGDEILTSTGNSTFTVGAGGVVTATCGNGIVESPEQCEAGVSACSTGFTCNASCACVSSGGGVITPIITGGVSTIPVTTQPGGGSGGTGGTGGTGSGVTPSALPKSAIDTNALRIGIFGSIFALTGFILNRLKKVQELDIKFTNGKTED